MAKSNWCNYFKITRFYKTYFFLRWNFVYVTNNNNIIIEIANNEIDELDIHPKRSFAAHGKLRSAITNLNGLCQYNIYANFIGHGWKKLNMFNESVLDADELSGFTHQLIFPCV